MNDVAQIRALVATNLAADAWGLDTADVLGMCDEIERLRHDNADLKAAVETATNQRLLLEDAFATIAPLVHVEHAHGEWWASANLPHEWIYQIPGPIAALLRQ
jgi:hypothetical protein